MNVVLIRLELLQDNIMPDDLTRNHKSALTSVKKILEKS